MLPDITINGTTRKLVDPDRCYITTDDEDAYPVLTSITAVPIDNPENFATTCYNEHAYGVYVAESALYLTELTLDTEQARNDTRIHKFALTGTNVEYRGSADIDGTVWRGGQADFRMSEHDGDLRVLASLYDWNDTDFVDHTLYVLREAVDAYELEILSTLPNENRPEEIGKPDEQLYGVRFLGDRAYAVTFLQIDPLYVIDLADPADPFIAGELEVTGFSDFLHPVNDALLLGLGRETGSGLKLELFDVSDLTQPLSRGKVVLGGPGSYSEALYDRHAFTYQTGAASTDRFAIPAVVYDEVTPVGFVPPAAGLYLFEIRDKDMPALSSLADVGSIQPPDDGTGYWNDRNRSFIHDDTVYFVRDDEVWAAIWDNPLVVNGPF